MYLIILGIAILLQATGSASQNSVDKNIPHVHKVIQIIAAGVPKKDLCNCDVSTKYIDIVQIDRSHIQGGEVEEIAKKMKETLDANYKRIYDILRESECNFPYVQRGLQGIKEKILDITAIFECPERRNDVKGLDLDVAVDAFVGAKDSMIADMRSASKQLSQECADIFTKVRPAACNTGENIIFAVLNSLHK